jgi:hypothetical protein
MRTMAAEKLINRTRYLFTLFFLITGYTREALIPGSTSPSSAARASSSSWVW